VVTGSLAATQAVGAIVYTGAFYGVQAGVLIGAQSILTARPDIPTPDAAASAIRAPIQSRLSGTGIARITQLTQALYEEQNGYAYDVFADHDGPITEILQWYANDEPVTLDGSSMVSSPDGKMYLDGAGTRTVQVLHREGQDSESAYDDLTTALGPSIWPSTSRGDGVCSIAQVCRPVKSKFFVGAYPNGVPIPTRAAKLQPVWDVRDVDQDRGDKSTYVWSDNPALGVLHYMTVGAGGMGLDYTRFIAPEIAASWTDAADDCDAATALKAGGTEPRYRCWLTYRHDAPPASVIKSYLASFDGWMAQRGDGALVIRSGRYYAPTVSIAAENIVAYSVQRGNATDDVINALEPSFVSAAHAYSEQPVTQWSNAADIAARGRRIPQPFSLPQSPSPGQSSRIAKRVMSRNLAARRGWIQTDLSGFNALGERYINIELVEAGTTLFSGPVEVTDAELQVGQGVRFTWVQADPDIDDWDPATEEGDGPDTVTGVVVEPLDPPTITTVVADVSTAVVRLLIDVSGPSRDDLSWAVRWRLASESDWAEASYEDVDPTSGVRLVLTGVPANASVVLEAEYSTGAGVASGWSSPVTVSTSTSGPLGLLTEGGDVLSTEAGNHLDTET
jgi:hypothetical protein